MAEERVQRRLAAILAADVVGYGRLVGEDEEGTIAAVRRHIGEIIEPEIAACRGRVFKTMGDGLLAEFASVVDAVRCALAIQEAIAERGAQLAGDRRIAYRIGVHLGDVIIEGDDVFGDGVNIAARLEGIADAGGICISGEVKGQVEGKIEVAFEDLGEKSLKNIDKPIRVWRLDRRAGGIAAGAGTVAAGGALALPDKPSIAVLAFENMSGDADQEYFSDGMSEDILTELTKISGLFVIARQSSFAFKGKGATLRELGRALGVRYALEGSVRKVGNRVRITAQLIDTADDHHLWAERYDRDLEDIFAVQDEVARAVAAALAVALKPDEGARLSRNPTVNLEAYDLFLRARLTSGPPTLEQFLNARMSHGRVIEIDPDFAGGHAAQSMTHGLAVLYGLSEQPRADAEAALRLAQRAVALDDKFALAHSALGLAYMIAGRHDEAITESGRAVDLQPGDADSYLFFSMVLLISGRTDDAYEAVTTALRLDPQYIEGPYLNLLGSVCFIAGRLDESIAAFKRHRDRGGPVSPPPLTFLTAALSAAGHMAEARERAAELLNIFPDFSLARYPFLYTFKDRAVTDRLIDALRQAGLPE